MYSNFMEDVFDEVDVAIGDFRASLFDRAHGICESRIVYQRVQLVSSRLL